MAKGKRVSNKPGREPGKRARKTGQRHYQNVARRRIHASQERTALLTPRGQGKAGTTRKPPGTLRRLANRVTRFFRKGVR